MGAWLSAGLSLAAGFVGCGPKSPVVGEETGHEIPATTGGSGGMGNVDLIGSADVFVTAILTNEEPGEPLCLPHPLPIGSDGEVACVLFKARLAEGEACRCDDPGSRVPSDGARRVVEDELVDGALCDGGSGVDCSDYCICEEPAAAGASAVDCLTHSEPAPSSSGWCYVDDSGRGAPVLVANCPEGMKQKLRILPQELAREPDSQFFLACSGGSLLPGSTSRGSAPVGAPCLPTSERASNAGGFAISPVELEFGSLECASNICLVNHFQGRVSCPYGQSAEDALENPRCFLPDSEQPVTVPVDPQLVARQADDAVICSCRCDGPDPSASYCACPAGMECAPMVRDIGVPDTEGFVGSYCIPQGTAFDPTHPPEANLCTVEQMNCGDPRPY